MRSFHGEQGWNPMLRSFEPRNPWRKGQGEIRSGQLYSFIRICTMPDKFPFPMCSGFTNRFPDLRIAVPCNFALILGWSWIAFFMFVTIKVQQECMQFATVATARSWSFFIFGSAAQRILCFRRSCNRGSGWDWERSVSASVVSFCGRYCWWWWGRDGASITRRTGRLLFPFDFVVLRGRPKLWPFLRRRAFTFFVCFSFFVVFFIAEILTLACNIKLSSILLYFSVNATVMAVFSRRAFFS